MAKKKKEKWVQVGDTLVLTVKARRKRRRPDMFYSIEFNFKSSRIDDKKKVRYNRKQKYKDEHN